MSPERLESISALLDDELAGEERDRALDALLDDQSLRERWRAYNLIGDVLRARKEQGDDLAARVRAALDKEPEHATVVPLHASRATGRSWLRPLGGLALAAGLATVAVLGGRSFEITTSPPPLAQAAPTQDAGDSAAGPSAPQAQQPATPVRTLQFASADTTRSIAAARMQWSTPQPAVQQRLNAYLVDYSEYLGADLRGMLPYARVVGYDGRQP